MDACNTFCTVCGTEGMVFDSPSFRNRDEEYNYCANCGYHTDMDIFREEPLLRVKDATDTVINDVEYIEGDNLL